MSDDRPPWTKEEWDKLAPEVARAMHEYIEPFCVPISMVKGDYGEGWGSGCYLRLGGRTCIVTNEHIARAVQRQPLAYQLAGIDSVFALNAEFAAKEWPLDLAMCWVPETVWTTSGHRSKAVTCEMMALVHAPAPGELLTFAGYSGDRVRFHFGALFSRGNSSTGVRSTFPTEGGQLTADFTLRLTIGPILPWT